MYKSIYKAKQDLREKCSQVNNLSEEDFSEINENKNMLF